MSASGFANIEAELARKKEDGTLSASERYLLDKLAWKDHAIADKEAKLTELNREVERLWTVRFRARATDPGATRSRARAQELDRFLRVPTSEAAPPPPPPAAELTVEAEPAPPLVSERDREARREKERQEALRKQELMEREAELQAEQDILRFMDTCTKSAIPAKPSIYGIKSGDSSPSM